MKSPGEALIIKLWESLVDKGIGKLLQPWHERRVGLNRIKLRADEMRALAQAEVDAADIRAGRKGLDSKSGQRLITLGNSGDGERGDEFTKVEPKLVEKIANDASCNAAANAVRHEINVSKAVIYAEEVLSSDEQKPSDKPIDADWLYQWEECAGKVSSEDLQRLWGRVLAGEVKSPGRYSLRTLDFLRMLSKEEAESISSLASFVVEQWIYRNTPEILAQVGLNLNKLLELQNLGVISGVESIGLVVTLKSTVLDRFALVLRSNGKALVITHDDPNRTVVLEIYTITATGKQLFELGTFGPNEDYLKAAGKHFVGQGFTVHLADWTQDTESQGTYSNGVPIS